MRSIALIQSQNQLIFYWMKGTANFEDMDCHPAYKSQIFSTPQKKVIDYNHEDNSLSPLLLKSFIETCPSLNISRKESFDA